MHDEVILELNDETLIKLYKLAGERGVSLDELANQCMRELLDEAQSSGS